MVWSEHGGVIAGQVYVTDTHASFTEGLSRHDAAYIDGQGNVVLLEGKGSLKAATFNGERVFITYVKDKQFASDPIAGGDVVFHSDTTRASFRYNTACSEADAAVGAVALFHLVFPSELVGDF